jgi:transcriptional regulator with GAF, ATPase, and Fis domain
VVGILHLSSLEPGAYGAPELARLEIVGNQIAGAIASGILLQAERDRAGQLKSLYDVAAIIAHPQSFEEKAQKIVEELVLIVEADNVVLRKANKEQTDLTMVASAGERPVKFQRSLSNTPTFEAYIQGRSILVNHLELTTDFLSDLVVQGVSSLYFRPINSRSRMLGSITAVSMTPGHFDQEKVDLIKAFSNELASLFNSAEQRSRILESQAELKGLSRELASSNQALESHYLVSRVFSGEGSFDEKAEAALEVLVTITGSD